MVEGSRFQNPNKKFVKTINKFCKTNNVCLIIDEITSDGETLLVVFIKNLVLNLIL